MVEKFDKGQRLIYSGEKYEKTLSQKRQWLLFMPAYPLARPGERAPKAPGPMAPGPTPPTPAPDW